MNASSASQAGPATPPGGDEATTAATLGDYVDVVRRRWRAVSLTMAAVLLAGLWWNSGRIPVYEAITDVLVVPTSSDPLEPSSQRRPVNLAAEAQIARSTDVVHRALAEEPRRDFDAFRRSLTVRADEDAQVLVFRYADREPEVAQALATAAAESYLELRTEKAQAALATVNTRLQEQLGQLQEELNETNATIAELSQQDEPASGAQAEALVAAQNRQSLLTSQLSVVANELANRSLVAIQGGEVLTAASLPTDPAGLGSAQLVVLAVLAAALAGLAAAFLRDRLSSRILGADDVERATGVPVVDDRTSRAPASTRRDPGRLLAMALRERRARGAPRLTLVTELGSGRHAARVAADLAERLGRDETVVFLADGGRHGLRDVLTPQAALAAPHGNDDTGTVRVIEVPKAGAEDSSMVARTLDLADRVRRLDRRVRHMIVLPPPAGSSLDVLEYADVVDNVVVVAVDGRTTRTQLCDTISLLKRHGLPVVGIVLDRPARPRLGRSPKSEQAHVSTREASFTAGMTP